MHVGFWCMICDHVADFRCTTDDKAVKAAGPKTPTRCKLALCWKCSLHYMNMGMDLELAVRNRYMIEDRIVRNKRGEILSEEKTIIRADAGFLSKDGEMWSQVMKPKLNALEQSAGGASSPEQT